MADPDFRAAYHGGDHGKRVLAICPCHFPHLADFENPVDQRYRLVDDLTQLALLFRAGRVLGARPDRLFESSWRHRAAVIAIRAISSACVGPALGTGRYASVVRPGQACQARDLNHSRRIDAAETGSQFVHESGQGRVDGCHRIIRLGELQDAVEHARQGLHDHFGVRVEGSSRIRTVAPTLGADLEPVSLGRHANMSPDALSKAIRFCWRHARRLCRGFLGCVRRYPG